jgi:hypothetical protein
MISTDTQKKCPNCEELIHPYATSCPYCSSDLSREEVDVSLPEQEEIPEAPYQVQHEAALDPEQVESPFRFVGSEEEPIEEEPVVGESPPPSEGEDLLVVLKPMAMLLGGMVFLLFGLALFLFARNGVLTLNWNGSWWPFYLVTSLPMLFFGWRSLHEIDEVN